MRRLVPSNLNRMRRGTQSQIERGQLLNSYSPIYSLPREILSLIFQTGQARELRDSFYIDDDISEDALPVLAFEVLLTHVSSHFRDIAIDTHLLWTFITTTRSVAELAAYMARSDGCALSVRIDEDTPTTRTREKIKSILPHFARYQQLIIHTIRESTDIPIIRCFSDQDAPSLKHLSISVEDVEEGVIDVDINLLTGGAPILSFVRLRGLAIPLFMPPLHSVTTLHLDQILSFPIQYATFCHMITASPSLKHLSIYGDITNAAWPVVATTIDLPSLRSLRMCSIGGDLYSNVLLGLNAPGLTSLVLKDVQEADLDRFWASPDVYKFPLVQDLSFNDFEVSNRTYTEFFRAFPAVTHFSTTYPLRTPMILYLLAQWGLDQAVDLPWPELHTLNFSKNLNDVKLIKAVVQARIASGHPLIKMCIGMKSRIPLPPQSRWLRDNIKLEVFQDEEQWPGDGSCFDPDDNLFD